MQRLLIILMLASVAGFGQARPSVSKSGAPKKAAAATGATEPNKWPIISIQVEGNHHYTREQILAVAGLKTGQVAGKEEFDAARDRLVASGFFEMVAYRFDPAPGQNGEIGSFQVTEVEPAYPVRFEALGVSSTELEALLKSKDPLFSLGGLPPNKPVLDRYVVWLQEFLNTKGSTEKIAARVQPAASENFEIVFRPARNYPSVAQVTFEGNRAVPQNVLRDAISGVAVGVPYTESHFRELLDTAVRPVYEARGRLRVSFPKVRTEAAGDVEGLHVFVTVDEGESYELKKFEIAGPTPLRPEELLRAAKIPIGEMVNFDRINEGLEQMRKALLHAGYKDAKLTTSRSLDDENKTVDVAVHVEPGPLFLMGKLTIAGLDLDGEAEIRRIFGIKEGKPFDADYPDMFLKSVREQGLFDNLGDTKAGVTFTDNHTADVTLTFGGAKPQTKQRRGHGGF